MSFNKSTEKFSIYGIELDENHKINNNESTASVNVVNENYTEDQKTFKPFLLTISDSVLSCFVFTPLVVIW